MPGKRLLDRSYGQQAVGKHQSGFVRVTRRLHGVAGKVNEISIRQVGEYRAGCEPPRPVCKDERFGGGNLCEGALHFLDVPFKRS